MTETINNSKPTIVFVDHEDESIKEVIGKIGFPKRARSTMERVSESCELIPALVNAVPRDSLFDRVVNKITEVSSKQDLILVDLSFDDESRESKSVEYGRDLALRLKDHFKRSAVGVYSKYDLSPRDRAFISSDGFSLVLEEIRKMYDGSRSLTGDAWYDLFKVAIERARKAFALATPPHALALANEKARWVDGHPIHRSRGFIEAAPKLADLALEWLPNKPAEVFLTELGGGFSGAYVVKASLPDTSTSFVIKIDEEAKKLEKELDGYRIFQSRVDHRYYLPIVGQDVKWPITLYEEWWGAFLMSYEGGAKPLLDYHINPKGEPLADIYKRVWSKCLFALYGPSTKKEVEVADIVTPKDLELGKEGSEALARYNSRLVDLDNTHRQLFDKALMLIKNPHSVKYIHNGSVKIDWVDHIHGDLNCRNILYDYEDRSFRLIDFPNVLPNFLAIDFVKAEVELVLIMMDWGTGLDCDIAQITLWGVLTDSISGSFTPLSHAYNNVELQRIFSAITTIREAFISYVSRGDESGEAYRLCLLSKVIRYISYPDLTIAKRFLALIWVGQLASAKW